MPPAHFWRELALKLGKPEYLVQQSVKATESLYPTNVMMQRWRAFLNIYSRHLKGVNMFNSEIFAASQESA